MKTSKNLVPLMDVVVLLLGAFVMLAMVQEPATRQLSIHLPRIPEKLVSEPSRHLRETAAEISITKEGKLFLNEKEISREALKEELRRLKGTGTASLRLVIRADAEARFQVVSEALAVARGVGISRIEFPLAPALETEGG